MITTDLQRARAPQISDDFAEREEACRSEYSDKRHDAIRNLKRKHEWSDEEAEKFFDGDEDQQKHGHTLDFQLRSEVNRNHRFPANRPI